MKILVIEDKEANRKAAEETLSGHDITIVESFDEAIDMMSQKIDEKNVERLLAEAGFPTEPDWKNDHERYIAYSRTKDKARKKSVVPFPFEVVLTDMMMSENTEGPAIRVSHSSE